MGLTNTRRFWNVIKPLAISVSRWHLPVNPVTRTIFGVFYTAHVIGREALIALLRFLWYEPLFRSQCEHVGQRLMMEQLPYITGTGRIVLGADVRLSGKSSIGFGNRVHDSPELVIGDGSFVGHNCAFLISKSVTIGKHCLLATGVRISDFDGHPIDAYDRRRQATVDLSEIMPVSIGNDVWIGTGAYVLKGVRIGHRSIVGAGAVVVHDVPPDVIVAGVPARIIKHLEVSVRNESSND
jgi:acetyltransferase-like isoleucine patch superfamily enzyme